jgi:DNA sulfur modification protein DndD
VVGEYLREIEQHVQKKYLIHFERLGDIGQSTVKPGYFEHTGNGA